MNLRVWVIQAPIWGICTVGVATCRNLHMLVTCLQNIRSEVLDDPPSAD